MRTRAVVATGVVLVLVAMVGLFVAFQHIAGGLRFPFAGRSCTVQAAGQVELDAGQMANAATIAAIGAQRGMPERAVVVALATAYQESGLRNLAGGDRDSVGLFQQRPSQGWGSPAEIRDPRYATNTFYAALAKVRDWEEMRVTDAAQTVQRSAFPEAYQKWADESEVLSRALLGQTSGAVACAVSDNSERRGAAATAALTQGLALDWGLAASAAATDLTRLTVTVDDERGGWRYAHWLVSHAQDNGVQLVRFQGLQWTAEKGVWDPVAGKQNPTQVVAEVLDAS